MEIMYKKTKLYTTDSEKEFRGLGFNAHLFSLKWFVEEVLKLSDKEKKVLKYFNSKIAEKVAHNVYYFKFFNVKIYNSGGSYMSLTPSEVDRLPKNFSGITIPSIGAYDFRSKKYIQFSDFVRHDILNTEETKYMFSLMEE